MSSTLVLGHLNPDTDTTCSALAYAWYLSTQRQTAAEAVVCGSLNKETAFALRHFGQAEPRRIDSLEAGQPVVIVDTNNPEELPSGHTAAKIVELIDHHKLFGGLSSSDPIKVTMRPVACTATILLEIMGEELAIPSQIAGLMLAAILSDTLNFTSPTTTEQDRSAGRRLAELAGCSPDELAEAMFAAKSDLSGLSPQQILTLDSKVVQMGSRRVRISSLETTQPANALAMRAELEEAMREMKQAEGLDAVFLFVVDILASAATLVVSGDLERQAASQAFGRPFEQETLELPGVVSRKKQMLPPLEQAFRDL